MRNYFDSDDGGGKSTGLQGTAAAFKSGFDAVGKDKKKKDKPTPKKPAATGGTNKLTQSFGNALGTALGKIAPAAKKGGRVVKTGLVRVHRGEDIIPAKHPRRKVSVHKRTTIKA